MTTRGTASNGDTQPIRLLARVHTAGSQVVDVWIELPKGIESLTYADVRKLVARKMTVSAGSGGRRRSTTSFDEGNFIKCEVDGVPVQFKSKLSDDGLGDGDLLVLYSRKEKLEEPVERIGPMPGAPFSY